MLAKYGPIQLAGKLVPGVIGFAVAAALTRLVSPEEYGVYGLCMAVAQFTTLAGFAWLGLSVARFAAGRPTDPSFNSSVLALFAVLVLISAAAALVSLLPGIGLGPTIATGLFGAVAFAYLDLRSSFHTAALEFVPLFVLNLCRAVAGAVAGILVAYGGGGGLAVFSASSAAMMIACLLSGRRGLALAGFSVDPAVIKRLCRFGLPIAASLVLFAASAWSDRVILAARSGTAAVGYFTAATVIVQNTLQLAAAAIGSVAYPLAVVAYESGGHPAADRQLARNLLALLGFLLPGAVGLCLLAPNIAGVLVGKDYRDAVIALTPWLAAGALLSGIRGNFVEHAFHLTRSTWHFTGIALVTAAVNLAALLALIPRFGYLGAGVASFGTAAAGLLYAWFASRRVYRMPFPSRDVAKLLLATLAMAIVLELLDDLRGAAALCVQIAAGGLAYAGAAVALDLLSLRRSTVEKVSRWLVAVGGAR